MKYKKQPKQRIKAWLLVSTYAMFWLSWSLHHFISPEHQHETKVCRHAPNDNHFHGEEYAASHCSICQIAPTLAELPDIQIPALSFPELIPAKNNFGETICLPVTPFSISQPRAPPAPLSWTNILGWFFLTCLVLPSSLWCISYFPEMFVLSFPVCRVSRVGILLFKFL